MLLPRLLSEYLNPAGVRILDSSLLKKVQKSVVLIQYKPSENLFYFIDYNGLLMS